MKKTADYIIKHWDEEQYTTWFAVDELTYDGDVLRLFVGESDAAYRFAADLMADAAEDTLSGAPFYRVTVISTSVAHDWWQACAAGVGSNELLTPGQAAKKYAISRQTVHDRINRGRIPAEAIGGVWYVMDASMALFAPLR